MSIKISWREEKKTQKKKGHNTFFEKIALLEIKILIHFRRFAQLLQQPTFQSRNNKC